MLTLKLAMIFLFNRFFLFISAAIVLIFIYNRGQCYINYSILNYDSIMNFGSYTECSFSGCFALSESEY